MDSGSLLKAFYDGDFRSLARVISMVENSRGGSDDILLKLNFRKYVPVIGITGPPGAGKSTLLNGLIHHLAGHNRKVGVIAIDPSSPFNLGSLLGDRLRMNSHFLNPDIFIRSVATRGSLGGLSDKTMEITDVMRAFGFDYIIVETVGVGQSEIEIAGLADLTLLVMVPGSGDEVQLLKAGIIEVADVIALNKSDMQGADHMRKILLQALSARKMEGRTVELFNTVATEDKGTGDLAGWIKNQLQNIERGDLMNEKKLWLMAEKAYRLIIREKMKGISRQYLMEKLKAGTVEKKFNLYRFVKDQIE